MKTQFIELNDAVGRLCKQFWKLKPDGKTPARDCCNGCPIQYSPCAATVPSTVEHINRHTVAMNEAADRYWGNAV